MQYVDDRDADCYSEALLHSTQNWSREKVQLLDPHPTNSWCQAVLGLLILLPTCAAWIADPAAHLFTLRFWAAMFASLLGTVASFTCALL
jgi:hypothetical protein